MYINTLEALHARTYWTDEIINAGARGDLPPIAVATALKTAPAFDWTHVTERGACLIHNHEEVAKASGMSMRTLTRVKSSLKAAGFIEVHGYKWYIPVRFFEGVNLND